MLINNRQIERKPFVIHLSGLPMPKCTCLLTRKLAIEERWLRGLWRNHISANDAEKFITAFFLKETC